MLDFRPTSAFNTERYVYVHYIYTCISPHYTVHILCTDVRLSTLSFEHKTSVETVWLQGVILHGNSLSLNTYVSFVPVGLLMPLQGT